MKPFRIRGVPLPVSPLSLGTWAFSGDKTWGPQAERDSIATVHAALDAGITVIDTAPLYGDGLSEEIVGRALQDRRDRALVATKISDYDLTAEKTVASCESSLRRLRTDRIDLLQIHWPGSGETLPEVIAAMEKLRAAGKVLACGVCNFGPESLAILRRSGHGWVTNQLPYNLIFRAVEFEILGQCAKDNLAVMCYSPLQQGLLSGRFLTADDVPVGRNRTRHFRADRPMTRHGGAGHENLTFDTLAAIRLIAQRINRPMADVALAWLLRRPAVASVIFGARNPAQIRANASAAEANLDPSVIRALDEATSKLKAALGPSVDMWAGESRIR
jgi:aryl-alcohol dehydrogenase-like predicted oxidoreductase